MPLNFDSVVALAFAVILGAVCLFYILIYEPLARAAPRRARFLAHSYYARLIQLGANILFRRAFVYKHSGDTIDPKECALVLANHQSVLDYFVMYSLAKHQDLRNVFFFIHGRCVRFPTVKVLQGVYRGKNNWCVPPKRLDERFAEFNHTPKTKWIIMFPEVSMFNVESSHQHEILCYAAGAKTLHKLLYPRFPGVVQAVQYVRRVVTAVYTVQIQYAPASTGIPQLPELSKVVTSDELDWILSVHTSRIGIGSVPRKVKKIEKWLEKMWFQMDKNLAKSKKL